MRANPGDSCHWKTITGLTNSPNLMGWVPEGRRAPSITYNMTNASQAYATMGTEDDLTDEAKFAAEGFDHHIAYVERAILSQGLHGCIIRPSMNSDTRTTFRRHPGEC